MQMPDESTYSGVGEAGKLAGHLRDRLAGHRVMIVTDREVGTLHLDAFKRPFAEAGALCDNVSKEMAGTAKSLDTVKSVLSQLVDNDFGQGDLLIGLGGGNVQDVAGFSASMFRGGLTFVAVPTSLYAMTAMGGSTRACLNFSGYKDMLSIPASATIRVIDPVFLETLPQRQYANGMSEIIRAACLADAGILDRLATDEFSNEELVRLAVAAGMAARSIPEECHLFGAQLGRVIEEHFRFMKYTHGEAVALGMLAVVQDPRLVALLEKYGLPIRVEGVGIETLIRKWVKSLFPTDSNHSKADIVTADMPGQPKLLPVRRDDAEEWFTAAAARIS